MSKKETSEVFLKDLNETAQELMRETLVTGGNAITNAVITTGLEILKQLIVINGAGIAGAAALTSTQHNQSNALLFFCLGMMLSILAMIMSYIFTLRQMLSIKKNGIAIMLNTLPLSVLQLTWKFKLVSGAIWLTAIASVGMFIIGIQKLTSVFSF